MDKLKGIVETPFIPDGYVSSFAQYTIKLKNKGQRDKLQQYLKEKGIPSMVYYVKPMHKQGAYAHLTITYCNFDVTSILSSSVLSLPMHPYMNQQEVSRICDEISSCVNRNLQAGDLPG